MKTDRQLKTEVCDSQIKTFWDTGHLVDGLWVIAMAEVETPDSPSKRNRQKNHKKKHKKKHHKKKHGATKLEDGITSPDGKSTTVENATKSQTNSSNIIETKTGKEIIETKEDSVARSTAGKSDVPSKNEENAPKSIELLSTR